MNDQELESLLLDSKIISRDEFNRAFEESKKLRRPLERVIADLHILSRSSLYELIAQKMGYKYVNLSDFKVDSEALKVMPENIARQTQSVPLKIEKGVLQVAMVDPADLYSADQIQMQTNMSIEIFFSSPEEIEEVHRKIYAHKGITKDFMDEMIQREEGGVKVSGTADGASVIKLVDLIIAQAVRDRASDIHLEPDNDVFRVRFRIDGILHEIPSPPKQWEGALISRIKVLCNMDIAETRVPQDGHFQVKVEEKLIDFRVSTIPTIHGENIVMRLLDTASLTIGLERLGFSTFEQMKRYENLIAKPYGIILSTGPTGSGKTTTLYSALMRINKMDINIITIEDPVEYRLGLIRQIQINPKAGITFANGLRAILRQDPDVIMVGEIRDIETAVIAVQAALTGHLVFSTLHTNDAPSAITRLVNMGVEPFLISACLIGVMAQRLVRVLCKNCKEGYEPSKALLEKWGLQGQANITLYRGRGCDNCKGTGYSGRTGLYELMTVDDELREMILLDSTSTVAMRKKAQEKGMILLSEDGVSKALAGITSLEEVARVCEEHIERQPSLLPPQEMIIEPFVPTDRVEERLAAPEKVIDSMDIEEYQKRIANWLSKKR